MRQQHPGTGLADALQRLDCDFEVADVKDWKLQVDITYKESKEIFEYSKTKSFMLLLQPKFVNLYSFAIQMTYSCCILYLL